MIRMNWLLPLGLLVMVTAFGSAAAKYPASMTPCETVDIHCLGCFIYDLARGGITSPPPYNGGIPLAPIPDSDLKGGATWIVLCAS